MREVIFPAHARRIGEGRRLDAGLLEDVAEPVHARAGEVRGARPDRPRRRADGQRELLWRESAECRDQTLVLEIPPAIERGECLCGHGESSLEALTRASGWRESNP